MGKAIGRQFNENGRDLTFPSELVVDAVLSVVIAANKCTHARFEPQPP